MKLTEAQADTLHSIQVVAYAALLTDDERDELGGFIAGGLVQRRYEGSGGLMGLAKLTITEAGRAALAAARQEGGER